MFQNQKFDKGGRRIKEDKRGPNVDSGTQMLKFNFAPAGRFQNERTPPQSKEALLFRNDSNTSSTFKN